MFVYVNNKDRGDRRDIEHIKDVWNHLFMNSTTILSITIDTVLHILCAVT